MRSPPRVLRKQPQRNPRLRTISSPVTQEREFKSVAHGSKVQLVAHASLARPKAGEPLRLPVSCGLNRRSVPRGTVGGIQYRQDVLYGTAAVAVASRGASACKARGG